MKDKEHRATSSSSHDSPDDHEHAGRDHDEHDHDEHAHDDHRGHDHEHSSSQAETISLGVSGILVAAGLIVHWANRDTPRSTAGVALATMAAGGWFLLPKAWRAILRFRPDINLLVVIAAIGACVVDQWVEAATVVFLFRVAEWLEGWADRRARRATEALLELAPIATWVSSAKGIP
jgi:Zn2+/Cd2+-exporting ATPase